MPDHFPIPVALAPGVIKNDSSATARNRYTDTNLVRFWEKRPQKWLGWTRLISDKLDSPARGALEWVGLDQTRYMAWGTANKLWLMVDGVLHDITPSGLAPGFVDTQVPQAWGGGGWGAGGWGGGIPLGARNQARTWTLDKWGEDLIACPRGGTIYQWVAANGAAIPAQPIAGAPASNLAAFVTDLRFLVALGAHDGVSDRPLRIAWTDQEQLTSWPPNLTNKSGDLLIEKGNEIVGYCPTRGGWALFTDKTLHFFNWVGGATVFELDRQGTGSGLVGPHAAVDRDGVCEWMSHDGFYAFDGTIRRIPCDVQEHVFGNGRDPGMGLNRAQVAKVYASTNKAYNETIWFYPSANSTEVDRYVALNGDGWSVGELDRTTWVDRNAITNTPIATAPDGTIYQQDVGTTGDGVLLPYRLKSGNIRLDYQPREAATDEFMKLRKAVPDYAYATGSHSLTVEAMNYPGASVHMTKGPYPYNPSGYFSIKARGREFRFLWEGTGDFRMGTEFRVYATPDGGRA
jgi:hypothetical protein